MSADHKAAIAEARTVRRYLEALDEGSRAQRRGPRSRDSIAARVKQIDSAVRDADAFERLHLLQEKLDLSQELTSIDEGTRLDGLEQQFVEVAVSYSARKGIAYQTWRAVGVPASVLRQAGVGR